MTTCRNHQRRSNLSARPHDRFLGSHPWKHWYFWATHSRLKPVVEVARMIHGHLDNVLTYFDHRITNATSEGLNSKIQTIKKTPMVFATGSI